MRGMKHVHHLALLELGGLLCRRFTLGKLGPDQAPVVGPEVLACDDTFGRALKCSCKLGRASPYAICNVVEVPNGDAAGDGNALAVRYVDGGQITFKVHASLHQTMWRLSTSFDVVLLVQSTDG